MKQTHFDNNPNNNNDFPRTKRYVSTIKHEKKAIAYAKNTSQIPLKSKARTLLLLFALQYQKYDSN